MCRIVLIIFLFLIGNSIQAQEKLTIEVADSVTGKPIPAVTISNKRKPLTLTDSAGKGVILLFRGEYLLNLSCIGYHTKDLPVSIDSSLQLRVYLSPEQKILEDVTILSTTRNNQRIENAPLKVEVLGREEMDEENTIKPATIASILGDVSGVQIQQSSTVSGNANIRIQGLEGRYTQVLRDGMPLYDGFSGGFGILSIPPLDIKQVELIKGAASTLYGGGAIAGLVNIISRTPAFKQTLTATLNQTTLKESNINLYASKRSKHTGYTFYSGFTNQEEVDINKDGFSDVASLAAFVIHPRLFFYPDDKTTVMTGYTATIEKRMGGDMLVLHNQEDALHQYFEKNNTTRHSGELSVERKWGDKKISLEGGLSSFTRGITTSATYFKGNQVNFFSEASLLIPYHGNSLVAGINMIGDRFKILSNEMIALNNFSNTTTGIFIQNTWQLKEDRLIETGLRYDHHHRYGGFLLPRLAFFNRFNEYWATRLGIGFGYKVPDPFAAQVIDYEIGKIQPIANTVIAERSVGYNAELNFKKKWKNGNEIFINHAFFLTHVNEPIIATKQTSGEVVFSNAGAPVVTKGFDTYVQAGIDEWDLYMGYTFTIARRKYMLQNQFMPLTPKNRMAFTIVKELSEQWRIGLEGSYNGYQHRIDGSRTPGYFFMAALIERKLGKHFSVVLNGENLLDFRQSKKESLYTGSITNPDFVPLWAPIDGRVINLAISFKL